MLKEKLIEEFNRLQIEGMAKVTSLNELKGDYINLTYHPPSGQAVKLLDGNKIYYANELCKPGSDRCYGLAADEQYLLVCEYGNGGSDAEIVVFKRL